MGVADEDSFTSLAGRLARLEKEITPEEREKFRELARGKTIHQTIHGLLDPYNPDRVEEKAREKFGLGPDQKPSDQQAEKARADLTREARSVFTGELNEFIEKVRTSHEQIVDRVNIDEVEFAGWGEDAEKIAREAIADFETFIKENRDEITAFKIFYNQPLLLGRLTFEMLEEVLKI
ncbi:MAG: restriction endonuclease subunit R, partial [Desulfobacterales bacterium]|nr:restriction endonuclease subunit R [Desulfobacterales bacterium]